MPERIRRDPGPCLFHRLGMMEYAGALALQQKLLGAKLTDPSLPDRLLFVEHWPVFTLGRNGGEENLRVSQDFLRERGIEVIRTDRGGNITYHGPGQAVLYPVMDLEQKRLSVPDFVFGLEEIMKETCMAMGLAADRDRRNHGLWVGDAKIGSVGISLKKGISIHGLALNVNLDLTPFSWINPCGLAGQAMTSIAKERGQVSQTLGTPPSDQDGSLMDQVCSCFTRFFAKTFDLDVEKEDPCGLFV